MTFRLKPFATVWYPWPNNAHHIIPRSTLAEFLVAAAEQGAPNSAEMFDFIVDALLQEKYNLNDKPNVITLPLEDEQAQVMQLPRHLEGTGAGARNHPDYNLAVYNEVTARLVPQYAGLGTAYAARKHNPDEKAPNVRKPLENISEATYNQIIALGQAAAKAGVVDVSLDSISSALFR
jgi:hypothetical protein